MPWELPNPNITNSSAYLEPRLSNDEANISSNAASLADIAKKADWISVTDAPYHVKTDGTNLPSDIQAVINAVPWYSTVYFPLGTFNINNLIISKPLNLVGSSKAGTILLNNNPTVDAITFNNNCDTWSIENLTVRGNGTIGNKGTDATSGNGIVLDTAWVGNIRNVISQYHGQNGLYFKNSNWTIFVENCKFELNKLDGVRGYGWGNSQLNAIRFMKCRAGNNQRSGYNLWGTSLSIVEGTAEGNGFYGIEFNSDNQINAFTCRGIAIRDVHMEENQQGSMYFKVNASQAKVIQGLNIDGINIDHHNINGTGYSAGRDTWSNQAVIFAGGTTDHITGRGFRQVNWGVNNVTQQRSTSSGAVDFGGNFASDSFIHTLHPQDQASYNFAYLNMGAGTQIGARKKYLSGYLLAKGGITFSNFQGNSDNIAATNSCYFPLDCKDGAWVEEYGITVNTDNNNYSVNIAVLQINGDGTNTAVASGGVSGSGTLSVVKNPDVVLSGLYLYVIRVTVTLYGGSTQTFCNITNPYIIST